MAYFLCKQQCCLASSKEWTPVANSKQILFVLYFPESIFSEFSIKQWRTCNQLISWSGTQSCVLKTSRKLPIRSSVRHRKSIIVILFLCAVQCLYLTSTMSNESISFISGQDKTIRGIFCFGYTLNLLALPVYICGEVSKKGCQGQYTLLISDSEWQKTWA